MRSATHMSSSIRASKDSYPLITVITLSYRSKYLFETVRSVLTQSYPNIQYIISDDATEGFDAEGLRHMIKAENRGNIQQLQIFVNESNQGTVANFNRALREAKGTYIFPLAADDAYVAEDSLEKWTEAFISGRDSIMCACCENYDEDMAVFRGRWPRPDQMRLLQTRSCKRIYRYMERQKILPGCTMARTRDSLKTLGYYDERYRLLEDYPFMMRTLRQGIPIGFWPESAVRHRSGGVSDPEQMHPQLKEDMERFYNEEVFPFTNNPGRLKRYFTRQVERQRKRNSFEDRWTTASPLEKMGLLFTAPKFVLKKCYHRLFQI